MTIGARRGHDRRATVMALLTGVPAASASEAEAICKDPRCLENWP
jgi:hypothetical protein